MVLNTNRNGKVTKFFGLYKINQPHTQMSQKKIIFATKYTVKQDAIH